MKTIKQFNISLLIRGLIIPVILITTIIGGIRLNDEIVDLIDFGFNAKLATLSATSGAFIRLDDHTELIQPRAMSKIRSGPTPNSWLALSENGGIHQLHPDGSVSLLPFYPFLDSRIRFKDFAVTAESVIGLTSQGEFQSWAISGDRLSTRTRQLRDDASLSVDATRNQMAWGPDQSSTIHITDLNFTTTSTIDVSGLSLLDFAFNPDGQLVLLSADQTLVQVDPTTGQINSTVAITCTDSDSCTQVHSIAYQNDGSIWALSQALTLIDETGTIDADFYAHPNYHDHTTERYLDYVIPMREIRKKQHLTYFYSFILNERDRTISYVLDSSEDDDFTHIGYVDDELLLEDFIASTEVLMTNKPYVSSIKPWGQWGLVKIGFAPIYSPEGRGEAIMGADQNVSSISQVSREALVILSLSSFVFLLFGATASWFIARSLTSPLLAMKDNVLSIAAGFLDRIVADPSLKDLRPLASLFKEAGDNLKKEVVQGPQVLSTFEKVRKEQDYLSYLAMKLRQESTPQFQCLIEHPDQHRVAYYLKESEAFAWILLAKNDDIKIPEIHNGIFQLSRSLSLGNAHSVDKVEQITKLYADSIGVLVHLNAITHEFVLQRILPIEVIVDDVTHTVPSEITTESYVGNQILLKDHNVLLSMKYVSPKSS
jgi:HAMP domain-containing protein